METPSLELERTLWAQGCARVAGVDEVGRGCLSGPVVAAAVIVPCECEMLAGVHDSKKLSPARRLRLYHAIRRQALGYGVGAASVAEIERLNILHASRLAMQRALARAGGCDYALIDGNDARWEGPYRTVVKGDQKSYAIACASIVAKVVRDRLMRALARHYPGYAWERNAGYGTRAHLEGLEKFGVTPQHRRAYAPVQRILQRENFLAKNEP